MFIILLQLAMCVLQGGLGLWWRKTHGEDRYFLALKVEGQVQLLPQTVSCLIICCAHA